MSWIIGSLALLVALASLWLSSEAMTRIGDQGQTFIKAHITPLRNAIAEHAKVNASNTELAKEMGKQVESLEEELTKTKDAVSRLETEIAVVRSHGGASEAGKG